MKRRFAFGSTAAFVALMAIGPSSAAAASAGFHVEVVADSCVAGYQTSEMRAVAGGASTANELDVGISTQRIVNGHWRDYRGSVGVAIKQFTDNGRPHHIKGGRSGQAEPGRTERIVYNFAAFHDDNLLWETTITSSPCRG